MNIIENFSLQAYNSLALPAVARYFITINAMDELVELSRHYRLNTLPWLVLGSGSNVVFSKDYNGVIIHLELNNIYYRVDDEAVYIHAEAGVIWDKLVQETLIKGYPGLENLSLIPGTVGAAPVQNIGAYGIELKDYFSSLLAWDRELQRFCHLDANDCCFSYRHSIFKEEPGRYIILKVVLKLPCAWRPQLQYQALNSAMIDQPLSADRIRNVVCELRRSKLPDPELLPNAGSFFKNPCINQALFSELKSLYSDLPSFAAGVADQVKVPAAWLIEQAGWRGKALGAVGMYEKQALVLVNHGGASGDEVLELAQCVQSDVWEKFGVQLEVEPQIFGALTEN
ncbi:UDP-N-acetylmuramate dehydrogenase [Piscirickettsia litoralis]|uniref:UDP-N-acetylmuramate dehydrogenase n=1 Tax=Piscirickettsia litoralis TaxID=1891921 RepID=UPI000B23EAA0|nr:UDP-N-acetylmuramate dehydrogenase [Piscirickettsia litoralis]